MPCRKESDSGIGNAAGDHRYRHDAILMMMMMMMTMTMTLIVMIFSSGKFLCGATWAAGRVGK